MSASPVARAIAAFSCVVTLLCVSGTVRADAVYLNDDFADNERVTQDLPNSAQWTLGVHHGTPASVFGTLTATGGSLVLDHSGPSGNNFAATWAHFTPSGSPVSLAVGETMRLSYTVQFSGGVFSSDTAAFRFGLFNSNGSRTTTDVVGTSTEPGITSGTTFSAWRGYSAQLSVNSSNVTGNNYVIRERTEAGNGLYSGANYFDIAGTRVNEPSLLQNTPYDGFLEITRTATGVELLSGINGVQTLLATDTASPFIAFDSIAFFAIDAMSHNLVLDNVRVETFTAVPEPSTIALLGVLGAGVVVGQFVRNKKLAAAVA